jgi:hypothetical protein
MVAYTDSLGINKGSTALAYSYTNRYTVMEYDIDFAKIAAARTAASATALTSTDTLVLATLPKGSMILGGMVKLLKAEGAAATIDLGITGSLTLFANDFDCNTTVGTIVAGTTASGLTADTNVVMTVNSASMDVCKVKLAIVVVDLLANPGSIPNET